MGEQRLLRKGTDSGETAGGTPEPLIFHFSQCPSSCSSSEGSDTMCLWIEASFFKNKDSDSLTSKFLPSSVTISTAHFQRPPGIKPHACCGNYSSYYASNTMCRTLNRNYPI